MPDVKDVIKGLEEMLEDSKYNDSVNWNPWADTETLEDAIALLKAQEPADAIPVEWLREKIKEHTDEEGWQDYLANSFGLCIEEWQKEQEADLAQKLGIEPKEGWRDEEPGAAE